VRPPLIARTRAAQETEPMMLYVTALTALAALVYLGYAMIRPERF
jgi:hypothetical protein